MSKIHVYNLTVSKQYIEDPDLEIERQPRLRLPADPTDWDEMKSTILAAAADIPADAHVLVDGFGPYAALIQDLNSFRLLFTVYDVSLPRGKRNVGVTAFRGFTPAERYNLGIARYQNGNGRKGNQ